MQHVNNTTPKKKGCGAFKFRLVARCSVCCVGGGSTGCIIEQSYCHKRLPTSAANQLRVCAKRWKLPISPQPVKHTHTQIHTAAWSNTNSELQRKKKEGGSVSSTSQQHYQHTPTRIEFPFHPVWWQVPFPPITQLSFFSFIIIIIFTIILKAKSHHGKDDDAPMPLSIMLLWGDRVTVTTTLRVRNHSPTPMWVQTQEERNKKLNHHWTPTQHTNEALSSSFRETHSPFRVTSEKILSHRCLIATITRSLLAREKEGKIMRRESVRLCVKYVREHTPREGRMVWDGVQLVRNTLRLCVCVSSRGPGVERCA